MARRAGRGSRRVVWIGAGTALAAMLAIGVVAYGPSGPPPSRPVGAGLPPPAIPRPGSVAPEIDTGQASRRAEIDTGQASRRAEIVAEEARLAALRQARVQLEQEVAALRQEAEARRREMPGRKVVADGAAGPSPPVPPSASGGPGPTVTATPGPAAEAVPRGLRVFVHHRAGSVPGAAAAEEVAQTLRGAGVEVPSIRQAPFVPSTPVVRYFHEEDQAAAARLAGRLGRGWAIQDFRAFTPQPPPQTLEVWLPGQ